MAGPSLMDSSAAALDLVRGRLLGGLVGCVIVFDFLCFTLAIVWAAESASSPEASREDGCRSAVGDCFFED